MINVERQRALSVEHMSLLAGGEANKAYQEVRGEVVSVVDLMRTAVWGTARLNLDWLGGTGWVSVMKVVLFEWRWGWEDSVECSARWDFWFLIFGFVFLGKFVVGFGFEVWGSVGDAWTVGLGDRFGSGTCEIDFAARGGWRRCVFDLSGLVYLLTVRAEVSRKFVVVCIQLLSTCRCFGYRRES